jgi:glycosyltransferase involved in cell wall biosynthesis
MKDNPLVSVIINNYNYGYFLHEAIDSALNQTYSHSEVIVVDDGSTDDSREIIASYGNRIISILKDNGGQASAFNTGFAASQGDIICFLDSDDIFMPEKVAVIVDVFRCRQSIDWCFHSLSWFDNNTKTFIKQIHEYPSSEWDYRANSKTGKLPYIPTATSGLCFTRSFLENILPMPEAIGVTLSDNYLKLITVALSKGFFMNKKLAVQKIHNNNAYTLIKNNKQQLKARILFLTAYWIRVKFPSLYKVANNLFVDGLIIFWRVGGIESEDKDVFNRYLSSIRLLEKFEIYSRAVYRYLKSSKHREMSQNA